MDISLINGSSERSTCTQFSELLRCLLFLNQPKIILMPGVPRSAAPHLNPPGLLIEHVPQLSCWPSPCPLGKLGCKGAILISGLGRGYDGLANGLLALFLSRAPASLLFPEAPGALCKSAASCLPHQHFRGRLSTSVKSVFSQNFSWLPDFVIFPFFCSGALAFIFFFPPLVMISWGTQRS